MSQTTPHHDPSPGGRGVGWTVPLYRLGEASVDRQSEVRVHSSLSEQRRAPWRLYGQESKVSLKSLMYTYVMQE